MNDNPKTLLSTISQALSKNWELLLTATLVAAGAAVLQAYGEQTFDSLVAVLGKRLLLQILLIISCTLGYCVFLLVRKEKDKLKHHRGLYWASDVTIPFCPICYDDLQKKVHFFPSKSNKEPNKEVYECHICNHDFIAWDGNDFIPRPNSLRAYMKK